MNKDEVLIFLKKKGYEAAEEHGVPMIYLEKEMTARESAAFRKMLQEAGYSSSYGWRASKTSTVHVDTTPTDEPDFDEDEPDEAPENAEMEYQQMSFLD